MGHRSDRERNPNPEEPEAPLVVAGIPHRLLVETKVVDRRRRRSPSGWQRSAPRGRRRRAPAPRRQSITPRGAVEPSAPVVVLRIPWRSPIVIALASEVSWRWTTGSARPAEVSGCPAGTAGATTRTFGTVRTTGSAGTALRTGVGGQGGAALATPDAAPAPAMPSVHPMTAPAIACLRFITRPFRVERRPDPLARLCSHSVNELCRQ